MRERSACVSGLLAGAFLTLAAPAAMAGSSKAVWEAARFPAPKGVEARALKASLEKHVLEAVSSPEGWAPMWFCLGVYGEDLFFRESGETVYGLALCYPYLSASARGKLRSFVSGEIRRNPPEVRGVYPNKRGRRRELYTVPSAFPRYVPDSRIPEGPSRMFGVYALWAYGHYANAWNEVAPHWSVVMRAWRSRGGVSTDPKRTGDLNKLCAGAIGLARIAKRLGHAAEARAAEEEALKLLEARAEFERRDHQPTVKMGGGSHRLRQVRYEFLTPEVCRYLAESCPDDAKHNLAVLQCGTGQFGAGMGGRPGTHVKYTIDDEDRHKGRRGWYMTWGEHMGYHGESFTQSPLDSLGIFLAEALCLGRDAETLLKWVDMPWCKADPSYMQKAAYALRASGGAGWEDACR